MFTSGHCSVIVTIYIEVNAYCFVLLYINIPFVGFFIYFLLRPPAPVLWDLGDGKHKNTVNLIDCRRGNDEL